MANYEHLFSPFKLRNLELKNRIVMAPMATHYAAPDGSVTERLLAHYARRARGGAGMIVTESNYVSREGRGGINRLGLHEDRLIEGHRRLAEAIHRGGARACAQLHHAGITASPGVIGEMPVSASSGSYYVKGESFLGLVPRRPSLDEVQRLISAFGQAARRAREAGFDVVQIHAGHGYLINNFLSPARNKRDDRYGGSPDKRMRFLIEIIGEIRSQVGTDFPVSVRLTGTEHVEGGYDLGFILEVARHLERAGVDEINVSAGSYEEMEWMIQPMAFQDGCLVPFAHEIKRSVKVAVSTVGKIKRPEMAESIISGGDADLVYLGRPLLADPNFPKKAADGRLDEIRYCLSCNACIQALFSGKLVHCTVNYALGGDQELAEETPAAFRRRVTVIGGGPAGMEAARVAARRGHEVTLYEKEAVLGGQLPVAAVPPHKEDLNYLINYLRGEVDRSGVRVVRQRVEAGEVEKLEAEWVILATGADEEIPQIPGVNLPNVVTAIHVLSGKARVGDRVVILGGGLIGCETAEYLADRGRDVIIVKASEGVAPKLEFISRKLLVQRLGEKGVRILVNAETQSITEEGVSVRRFGQEELIPADTVILAKGMKPADTLLNVIRGKGMKVELVGDCKEPRSILEAVHEGARAALSIN